MNIGTQHWKKCDCGDTKDITDHSGNPCAVCGYDTATYYTVTFNANGDSGTPPTAMQKSAGDEIALPDPGSLTKSNYTFISWNTKTDGTGEGFAPGESYEVTGNVTLYAKWISDGVPTTLYRYL